MDDKNHEARIHGLKYNLKYMELNDKQKKTFKRFCLFLGGYGTKNACINFNFYNDDPEMDIYMGWYSTDIRSKIDSFEEVDSLVEEITLPIIEDNIDYYDQSGEITFCLDCIKKIITFEASVRELETNWVGEEWELSVLEELDSWKDLEPQITNHDEGVVEYEGSGDSGYINDYMTLDGEENISIPAELETWMYNQLENYGGWEINEGSQGKFVFDFKNGTISLSHGENYEEQVNVEIPDSISFA